VCGSSRQERASALSPKGQARQRCRGEKRSQPEATKDDRVPRYMDERPQHLTLELRPVRGEPANQPSVRGSVATQPRCGRLDRAFDDDGGAVVERMRDLGGRKDPLEPVLLEGKRSEERGGRTERVNCRAQVVDVTRQRQLR
jgi:hypothetical protein